MNPYAFLKNFTVPDLISSSVPAAGVDASSEKYLADERKRNVVAGDDDDGVVAAAPLMRSDGIADLEATVRRRFMVLLVMAGW